MNQPPFPRDEGPNVILRMTLRDYFAAAAMQGFITGHIAQHGHRVTWGHDEIASEAYELADAMLKEREK